MGLRDELYQSFWRKMDELTTSRPLSEEEKKKRQLRRAMQEDSALTLDTSERIFRQLEANPSLVVIDAEDAALIYRLFRRTEIAPAALKASHVAFLQAAMMSAINATFAMGFVEAAARSFLYQPAIDAKTCGKLLRKLAQRSIRHLFKMAHQQDLLKVEVYRTILDAISYSHRPYFDHIAQGAEI